MGFESSKEMFINMNSKDIPYWDYKKSYYDQSKDAIQFYEEEIHKMTYGVNIGGYFVHPWMYFHLNFFKTPIPQLDNHGRLVEVISTPDLNDNMFYVVESFKEAQEKNKILFLFGTRGASKSTFIASLEHHTMCTMPNGNFSIMGGSEGDLKSLSSLIRKSHDNIIAPFQIPTLKADWESYVEFGVKDKKGDKLVHSELFIKNVYGGSGKSLNTEKGAGLSPVGFVVDEAGKFDFLSMLQSAIPSFKTAYGWKLTPVIAGTGGNTKLSSDAKKVLLNPDDYDVLPVNYDLLSRIIPEEHITWTKNKKFGTFFPAQMTYREKIPRYDSNLGDFLGKKDPALKKIRMSRVDWAGANKVFEEIIDNATDIDVKDRNRMYYPRDIDDCFLTTGRNPFPVSGINARILELEHERKYGSPVTFHRENGKTRFSFSDKDKAKEDYTGGVVDAPFFIYNVVPEEKPDPYTYVSGLDDYKTDDATESVSHGAFYILKRRGLAPNEPCETIALSYVARPERHIDFHKNIEEAGDIWNAKLLMESIDTSYKGYLDLKHKTAEVLYPELSFSATALSGRRQSTLKYGMYPHKANNDYRMGLAIDMTKERHVLGVDENGEEVVKYGYDFIDDIDLLKEMRDYKKGKNCDRIDAFSYALVMARDLDNKGIRPNYNSNKNNLYETISQNKVKKSLKVNPYGYNNRINKF